MVRKFWWNPFKDGNRFFTPLAWTSLCKPLCDGGLSFRSFQTANEAFIAKLAWWVLFSRDSFCVRILRAKYKMGSKWLDSNPVPSASFSWKGVEKGRGLLSNGACKLVGSGESILIWEDPSVPDLPLFRPQPRNEANLRQSWSMAQLMKPNKSDWDLELLKQVFYDNSVKAIVNIPKWSCEDEDKWIWLKTSNGSLSVKSAYKELSTGGNMDHPNPLLGKIWKTHFHARHKMLLWRLAVGLLPTKDILRFATSLDPICIMCNDHAESAVHLFCECPN